MTDLSITESQIRSPRIHLGTRTSLVFASLSPLARMRSKEEFGPTITADTIKKICRRLSRLAVSTEYRIPLQQILAEPCRFSFPRSRPLTNSRLLVIDVGGSRVRVGLRVVNQDGSPVWQGILDSPNRDLDPGVKCRSGIDSLTEQISSLLSAELFSQDQKARTFDGTAVVWSNKVRNQPFQDAESDLRGITSFTDIGSSGSTYGSEEWWGRDLVDGIDLGRVFTQMLRKAGFNFKTFISGNDTCFTAKAGDQAAAGMVISSGAATTFKLGRQLLCHSQSGGIRIPVAADFPEGGRQNAISIQSLISGSGLPVRLAEWITYGAEKGFTALKELAEAIAAGQIKFQARDLSLFINGQTGDLYNRGEKKWFNPECLDLLQTLSKKLITRAAKVAAALAFFSVANQISEQRELVIILDSSQARYLPGYFQTMERQLAELTASSGCSLALELLSPVKKEGRQGVCQISVPMQGAANVLNDFLAFRGERKGG